MQPLGNRRRMFVFLRLKELRLRKAVRLRLKFQQQLQCSLRWQQWCILPVCNRGCFRGRRQCREVCCKLQLCMPVCQPAWNNTDKKHFWFCQGQLWANKKRLAGIAEYCRNRRGKGKDTALLRCNQPYCGNSWKSRQLSWRSYSLAWHCKHNGFSPEVGRRKKRSWNVV